MSAKLARLDTWAVRKSRHQEAWYDPGSRDANGYWRAFGGDDYDHSQVRAALYSKRYGDDGRRRRATQGTAS